MWKLSQINIENIVSFREATFTITQDVATLIFGKNEDNASQPCNGSGKSSLIEAISFALTGEQLRKVKTVEEIIHDTADEASVSLVMENQYAGVQMTIERHISRKAPQSIRVYKQPLIHGIEAEEIIMPTVADYNKYILNEIGLTKEEIYNNYILCDNKYEGFFDCSDKSKKEIINRFSNGVLVDEGIERLQKDIEPVSFRLTKAMSEVTRLKGAVSAVEEQLADADSKKQSAIDERTRRMESLDKMILDSREQISASEDHKAKAEERLKVIADMAVRVAEMEASEAPCQEAYKQLVIMCEEGRIGELSDYNSMAATYNAMIEGKKKSLEAILQTIKEDEATIADLNREHARCEIEYKAAVVESEALSKEEDEQKKLIAAELDKIEDSLDDLEKTIRAKSTRQAEIKTIIVRNQTMLNGAVTCPKCAHKFFLDSDQTVDQIAEELRVVESEYKSNDEEKRKLMQRFNDLDTVAEEKSVALSAIDAVTKSRLQSLDKTHRDLQKLSVKIEEAKISLTRQNNLLIAAQGEMERIAGKIETLRDKLFGKMRNLLDSKKVNGEAYICRLQDSITYHKGQLESCQRTKRELMETPIADFESSMKGFLQKYTDELATAMDVESDVRDEYNKLKAQELNFTMFKSYIAKKKINALSQIVNDFLEKIGSDIRLKLEGFTVTRSGKLRDKISIQVMRDGIDCGSYHKFSGGEKARLNLACILSLHTLTNSNCEDGKGLDFIIIDELLDKSDEVGLSTYCEALNRLHQTALLITQGSVSESYPHKLLIVKRQGVSAISE